MRTHAHPLGFAITAVLGPGPLTTVLFICAPSETVIHGTTTITAVILVPIVLVAINRVVLGVPVLTNTIIVAFTIVGLPFVAFTLVISTLVVPAVVTTTPIALIFITAAVKAPIFEVLLTIRSFPLCATRNATLPRQPVFVVFIGIGITLFIPSVRSINSL